jgi:hypothetical protein
MLTLPRHSPLARRIAGHRHCTETAGAAIDRSFREDADLDQALNQLIGDRIARAGEITHSFTEMIGCS